MAKASSQPVMIKAYNVSRMTAALREKRQREVDLLQLVAAARVPNVMRFVATVDDEHQACTIVERSSGAWGCCLHGFAVWRTWANNCLIPLLRGKPCSHPVAVNAVPEPQESP